MTKVMTTKHNFLALDVETTGLDTQLDQILQIGAVAYGGDADPVCLELLVKHERYSGNAYALQLNAELLLRLANGEGHDVKTAMRWFHAFVLENCDDRPFVVGFNVGKFDRAMVERDHALVRGEVGAFPTSHRVLELGSLWADPARGGRPTSSAEACQDHFGLEEMPHDALADAKLNAALHANWVLHHDPMSGWAARVWDLYGAGGS